MGHPVNWFHIQASDVKALEAFYKKTFGWKMSAGPGGMAFIAPDPGGIAGGIAPAMDGQNSISIYVGVDNVDAHLAKIAKAGGAAAMPKMELPDGMGWIAGFTDPAGNFVGLWQAGAAMAAAAAPAKAPKAKKAAKKPAPKKAAKVAAKAKPAAKKAPKKAKAAPKKAAKKAAKKASGRKA